LILFFFDLFQFILFLSLETVEKPTDYEREKKKMTYISDFRYSKQTDVSISEVDLTPL